MNNYIKYNPKNYSNIREILRISSVTDMIKALERQINPDFDSVLFDEVLNSTRVVSIKNLSERGIILKSIYAKSGRYGATYLHPILFNYIEILNNPSVFLKFYNGFEVQEINSNSKGCVYIFKIYDDLFKIGVSKRNVQNRLYNFQKEARNLKGLVVEKKFVYYVDNFYQLEKQIQEKYSLNNQKALSQYKKESEILKTTELFVLNEQELNDICLFLSERNQTKSDSKIEIKNQINQLSFF